jgi:SAM-dependent methyltransferase
MTFADHFSTVAARYAQYRPHYPPALVDVLADRCAAHGLAWDAGCGNGQLSVALAARFDRVIATDPAEAQLAEAPAHPNIEYRCATAEESGLPASCADLAVAAQAAHWFDWPRYVAEVERVTRPGALVALVSYGIMRVPGVEALAEYYWKAAGAYWPSARKHVENGYRDLAWPWPAVEAPHVDMTASWTREELLGYVATWSATVKLIAAEGPAKYEALCEKVNAIWPAGERRDVTWPLAIRLARR